MRKDTRVNWKSQVTSIYTGRTQNVLVDAVSNLGSCIVCKVGGDTSMFDWIQMTWSRKLACYVYCDLRLYLPDYDPR